jgi:hypothetical protein
MICYFDELNLIALHQSFICSTILIFSDKLHILKEFGMPHNRHECR